MKERNLGFLSSYHFKGKLLIAMNEQWKRFFVDPPTFEVIIDKDERYTLRGPHVNHNPQCADPTAVTGGYSDE